MRLTRKAVLVVALVAAAGSSQAAGLGLRAGTTGVGADLGWAVAPTLGGRLGLSGMKFNTDVDSGNVTYDTKAKIGNLSALLDWSPLGPFRISAGLVATGNKLDVTGQNQFGNLSGTVKPERSVVPYLGIGYGNVWTKGINFYFDLGIMFQGSPKADLSLTCSASVSPAQCTQAQNEVAAEERRLEDELKNFKYYPVLNLGITIGF